MMKSLRVRRRFSMAVAAAVIVAVAGLAGGTQSASAAQVIRFTDQFATAGFRSIDPSGCIQTVVLLTAGNDVDQEPPGPPTRTSGAFLRITQFDRCTGTFTVCSGGVSGEDSGVEFSTNPAVREATLTGTIPLRCTSSTGVTFVNAVVNMTWTGTGEADRSVNNNHFDFGDLIMNTQFRGATRDAVATGTVLLNGVNVTPNPSVRGEIVSETSHQVTVELP